LETVKEKTVRESSAYRKRHRRMKFPRNALQSRLHRFAFLDSVAEKQRGSRYEERQHISADQKHGETESTIRRTPGATAEGEKVCSPVRPGKK